MTPSAFVEALANLGVMGMTFGVVPVPILLTVLAVSSLASGTYAMAQSDTSQPLSFWLGFLTALTVAGACFGAVFLILNPV